MVEELAYTLESPQLSSAQVRLMAHSRLHRLEVPEIADTSLVVWWCRLCVAGEHER